MTTLAHRPAPVDGIFDLAFDPTGFQRVVALLDGITTATDGAELYLRLVLDGAIESSGYRWRMQSQSSSTSTDNAASAADTAIQVAGGATTSWGLGNGAGKAYAGRVTLSHGEPGLYKIVTHDGLVIGPTGNAFRTLGGGVLERTGQVTGLVLSGSAPLTAGRVTVYGVPVGEPAAGAAGLVSAWVAL